MLNLTVGNICYNLKVGAVLSFIPKSELAAELISIIEPCLVYSYNGVNLKRFTNNCVYWLREYFEKNIRLITDDYTDIKGLPVEERKKYSSQSPHNNLLNFDTKNCLILLELNSQYDETGCIVAPESCMHDWDVANLPTHIASYCLNILHKKYHHNLYQSQSAFVIFDKYFSRTYRYVHKVRRGYSISEVREWNQCILTFKSKGDKRIDFMKTINQAMHKLSTDNFPLIEVNGKKSYTRLITDKGYDCYQQFLDEAKEMAERYEYE